MKKKNLTTEINAGGPDRESARTTPPADEGLTLSGALLMADSDDTVALKKLGEDSADLKEELTPVKPPPKKTYKVSAGSKQAPDRYKIRPEEKKTAKQPVKAEYDPHMPEPQLGEVDVKSLYDAQPIPKSAPPVEKKKAEKKDGAYGLGVDYAVKQMRVKEDRQERTLYDPSASVSDEILAQMAHNELYMDRLNSQRKRRRLVTLIILVILLAMLVTFGIAAIVNFTAGFTISLSGSDPSEGITLYDNAALQNGSSYLTTERIPECDNITYGDFHEKLLGEIDNVDGLHSVDEKYFAYTFYVANNGRSVVDYEIAVNIISASKGVDDAVRVLVIEDSTFYGAADNRRNIVVTAKPQVDENGAWMYGEDGKPVMQQLLDSAGKPLKVQDNAVSFRDRTTTYYRKFEGLGNVSQKNLHKYTVMVYLEGGDPDCVSKIKGGGIKMNVEMKAETR